MNAITKILAEDLDHNLSSMGPAPTEPEDQVEVMAELHRRGVAKYQKRIADTRKGLKATLASLEADVAFATKRHQEAIAVFAERIAEAKDQATRDTAADRKLVAASRAALEALSGE